MKANPLKIALGAASAAVLCATASGQSVVDGTFFLPQPTGTTVVAGWLPTDASIVDGEFTYTGAWSTTPNGLSASYTNGSGSYVFNTTLTSNPSGSSSVYSMNSNSTNSISTSDYSGAAFTKVVLQLSVNYLNEGDTRDSDAALQGSLTIDGITYNGTQASFSSDRNYQPAGFASDPENRYYGNFGGVSLITYIWDLEQLGFSGDFSEFALGWSTGSHTAIYDAQVSLLVVPEPSTYALIIGSALAGIVLLRRRQLQRA